MPVNLQNTVLIPMFATSRTNGVQRDAATDFVKAVTSLNNYGFTVVGALTTGTGGVGARTPEEDAT